MQLLFSYSSLIVENEVLNIFTFSEIILQSNLDYPDSLGPDDIVRIIEGPDNRKYEH